MPTGWAGTHCRLPFIKAAILETGQFVIIVAITSFRPVIQVFRHPRLLAYDNRPVFLPVTFIRHNPTAIISHVIIRYKPEIIHLKFYRIFNFCRRRFLGLFCRFFLEATDSTPIRTSKEVIFGIERVVARLIHHILHCHGILEIAFRIKSVRTPEAHIFAAIAFGQGGKRKCIYAIAVRHYAFPSSSYRFCTHIMVAFPNMPMPSCPGF